MGLRKCDALSDCLNAGMKRSLIGWMQVVTHYLIGWCKLNSLSYWLMQAWRRLLLVDAGVKRSLIGWMQVVTNSLIGRCRREALSYWLNAGCDELSYWLMQAWRTIFRCCETFSQRRPSTLAPSLPPTFRQQSSWISLKNLAFNVETSGVIGFCYFFCCYYSSVRTVGFLRWMLT
jgi:hypothetical protein